MIKLIVGLGNDGSEYDDTRHNVGRTIAFALPSVVGVVVTKNDGYMNSSGSSVKRLVEKYKVSRDEVCIVHDDLAFEVGDFRVQYDRNANGHHGVESIIEALGGKDFWRVRVGIGAVPLDVEQEEYVLAPFSRADKKKLFQLPSLILEKIQSK